MIVVFSLLLIYTNCSKSQTTDSSYSMKKMPKEAPSLWTPYINLFKKQKVISLPLEWVGVLHHWNSHQPLQRDVTLTWESSKKPCKTELDPGLTQAQVVQAPAQASSSLLPGSVPQNLLNRKDGFLNHKEKTLQGVPKVRFQLEKEVLSAMEDWETWPVPFPCSQRN